VKRRLYMAKKASKKAKKKAGKKKAVKKKKKALRKPKKKAIRQKKAVKKKTVKKKTAGKKPSRPKKAKAKKAKTKKPKARKAVVKTRPVRTRPALKPKLIVPPSAPVLPGINEQKVGSISHYYSHLGVAVIRMERGELHVGDTIHVQGHTSNFRQRVESMEVEHQKISRVAAGQEFGLKVIDHAREHDQVYKVG
jgi:hypothetical protein